MIFLWNLFCILEKVSRRLITLPTIHILFPCSRRQMRLARSEGCVSHEGVNELNRYQRNSWQRLKVPPVSSPFSTRRSAPESRSAPRNGGYRGRFWYREVLIKWPVNYWRGESVGGERGRSSLRYEKPRRRNKTSPALVSGDGYRKHVRRHGLRTNGPTRVIHSCW